MKKLRALVVDDSAYNRMVLTQMLETAPGIEVAATAVDGVDAIAKTLRTAPDVITLDLEMPGMDGFTFLRWLMKEQPTPVIVVSSRADSRSVFRALELGAVDFLAKPEARVSRSIEGLRDELLNKVQAVLHLEMDKVRSAVGLAAADQPRLEAPAAPDGGRVDVVAIASSTGGPPAIQAILGALPHDLGAAIVIAQHMPPGFTKSFAERLNKLTDLEVKEAAEGDRIGPGTVLIAPGGSHLTIVKFGQHLSASIVRRSDDDRYVPSADRLMGSVAEVCGPAALGVVLTGMGNDGAAGVRAIKERKGRVLAESEESAVIFGMPNEAIRTGAVDKVLPLAGMAREIVSRCGSAARRDLA